jgi:hypothetical protein
MGQIPNSLENQEKVRKPQTPRQMDRQTWRASFPGQGQHMPSPGGGKKRLVGGQGNPGWEDLSPENSDSILGSFLESVTVMSCNQDKVVFLSCKPSLKLHLQP